jgi:hypothetical protein
MTFDVKSFISNFKPLEYYMGTDFQYFCVATHGDNKLALSLEAGRGPVKYKGAGLWTVGFGFRGIEVGEDSQFSHVFGVRGEAGFKDVNGNMYKGTRLFKTYLPLTNEPASGETFHKFAEAAFVKLYAWLAEKVEEAGGVMLLSEAEFTAACSAMLTKVDTTVMDLFTLPGVKPEWAHAPVIKDEPEPPTSGDDEPNGDEEN